MIERLRDALRDTEDERLSVEEIAAMRRVVLAAVTADNEPSRASSWLQPLAVAATIVAMVGAGAGIGRRFADRGSAQIAVDPDQRDRERPSASPERARQLQFATPGGTRIIWIFNSDLELKTTP